MAWIFKSSPWRTRRLAAQSAMVKPRSASNQGLNLPHLLAHRETSETVMAWPTAIYSSPRSATRPPRASTSSLRACPLSRSIAGPPVLLKVSGFLQSSTLNCHCRLRVPLVQRLRKPWWLGPRWARCAAGLLRACIPQVCFFGMVSTSAMWIDGQEEPH